MKKLHKEFWKYGNMVTLTDYLCVGVAFSKTPGDMTHKERGLL